VGTNGRLGKPRFSVIRKSVVKNVTPVTLPPGRLRLATRPCLTGSPLAVNTIGIVWVAALADCGEGDQADDRLSADQRRKCRPPVVESPPTFVEVPARAGCRRVAADEGEPGGRGRTGNFFQPPVRLWKWEPAGTGGIPGRERMTRTLLSHPIIRWNVRLFDGTFLNQQRLAGHPDWRLRHAGWVL
jgi:hypothetical protein